MAGQPGTTDVLRQAAVRTCAQFNCTGLRPLERCSQWLGSPAELGQTPAAASAFGLVSATGEFWIHGNLGGAFWIYVCHGFSGWETPGQRPGLLAESLRSGAHGRLPGPGPYS